jgi:gentisate 1,2-dioxygenase
MSIDVRSAHTVEVGYDEFCGALAAHDLQALWSLQRKIMPDIPLPSTLPWLWKWETVLPLAKRAGEIITIERGGDRRVLALANPGLNGLPFTSTTLWGAIQFLGPGESAPAHRHTPSAIRFVMAGSSVYTTVDGDACEMEAGDLVLTPNWKWHDHNNYGDEPMVWFDGLDLPLMVSLESIFFENHPDLTQEVRGHNLSEQLYSGPVAPSGGDPDPLNSPLLRYSRASTVRQLEALHASEGGHQVTRACDPHLLERDDAALPGRAHAHDPHHRQLGLGRLQRLGAHRDQRDGLRVGARRHVRRALLGRGRPRGERGG